LNSVRTLAKEAFHYRLFSHPSTSTIDIEPTTEKWQEDESVHSIMHNGAIIGYRSDARDQISSKPTSVSNFNTVNESIIDAVSLRIIGLELVVSVKASSLSATM